MAKTELLNGSNRGKRINEVSKYALDAVITRIRFEDNGISIRKVPICSLEQASRVAMFVARAKGGFAQTVKNPDFSNKHQERDMVWKASPSHLPDNISISPKETDNMLPEYQHVMTTIRHLCDLHQVDFLGFEEIPQNLDYQLSTVKTFWENANTPEHIWAHLDGLDTLTRKTLYGLGTIGVERLIKLAHFFAASSHVSNIFNI